MILNYNYLKDKNLGIAVERLAELSSVSLGEELACGHVRVCVRVTNVFPPVLGVVRTQVCVGHKIIGFRGLQLPT